MPQPRKVRTQTEIKKSSLIQWNNAQFPLEVVSRLRPNLMLRAKLWLSPQLHALTSRSLYDLLQKFMTRGINSTCAHHKLEEKTKIFRCVGAKSYEQPVTRLHGIFSQLQRKNIWNNKIMAKTTLLFFFASFLRFKSNPSSWTLIAT